ncbi:MAG: metE 1 [Gammaproteobacteria bacterium]|nr:metE 1 [Gammaproteobacteria bacterium]MBM2830484.1 metE 1 [Gammaproteobacteria bacterium]
MFQVTQVGSWPRSRELLRALRAYQKNEITEEDFNRIADGEVRQCLDYQLRAGVDIVVDGELRRDNFYSFVTEKLDGTRLMSLAEMLDVVEDKSGFEEMLQTLDVPASAIRNPTCVDKLSQRQPFALNDYLFLKEHTDKPVKITLPGPYLLTRSMWVGAFTGNAYADKVEMGEEIAGLLRDEVIALRDAGCAFVQFDEPVLTEVVFSGENNRRTFM